MGDGHECMRFSELGGGPPLIDGRARRAIARPARRTGSPDPHDPGKALRRSSRMLKNSFTPRLLKKVQMQGGARCEVRGVRTRTSQRRASAPTRQMGLFQQPARARADDHGAVSRGFRGAQHSTWQLLNTSVTDSTPGAAPCTSARPGACCRGWTGAGGRRTSRWPRPPLGPPPSRARRGYRRRVPRS